MGAHYGFRAELWLIPEQAGWHFLTLPPELAADIRDEAAPFRRGFGSIKVTATVAGKSWSTSIFPDSKSGSYLLPVKQSVRAAAGIEAGDSVDVELDIAEPG
ncbi:DUF1905 domain-containing protein [Arthrobacter celericrescens]|uniref:DUF1905 domain-containing protein n=1 Tax=Arthrobacter celericrescens TaxID=2320851 RepID=UPI000EA38CCB|nr:DUF1905 domain-containing protein [Arthrobacter celericrescens]